MNNLQTVALTSYPRWVWRNSNPTVTASLLASARHRICTGFSRSPRREQTELLAELAPEAVGMGFEPPGDDLASLGCDSRDSNPLVHAFRSPSRLAEKRWGWDLNP